MLATLHQLVGLEPVGETQVLIADQLDAGEAVVDLGDVDLARGHPGHLHRRFGCAHRRRKGRHVGLVLVHHPVHAQAHTAHPHRTIGVTVHDLLGCQNHRGGAVALRSAVVEPERIHHHRRGQCLLDGDLIAQLGFRVLQRVEVVLHRDHRHVFLGRRRLVQISHHVQREVGRRNQSQRIVPRVVAGHRRPFPERGVRRRFADLVRSDHQHHVVDAGRDRQGSVADRIIACGAGIFDAGHRDIGEVEGVREDARTGIRRWSTARRTRPLRSLTSRCPCRRVATASA